MTNAEIVAQAKKELGIEGQAHTYRRWQQLGFVVKRGEHAAFSAKIWQKSKGWHQPKDEEGEGEEQPKRAGFYLQKASFFTESQVQPIGAEDE